MFNLIKLTGLKMKRLELLLMAAWMVLGAGAQLPQFSPNAYDDWVYNNPSIELNRDNIIGNRVVLYVDSHGLALTLTSPTFECRTGEVIDLTVTWVTKFWQAEDFVVSKAGFTAALIDLDGVARDSVTFTPTSLGRENQVNLTMRVSHGMKNARLRFAGWKSNAVSSGAVRQIVATSTLKADVNLDGEVTVADINEVIDYYILQDH